MKRIRARGVSVRLGDLLVLDDVGIDLEAGRATMLVGPNGAGKSTLIKVLLGLVRPDYAIFELDDQHVAIDNAWKSRIGYLPEAVAFSENLTALQLLRFFAQARGCDRSRVEAVLDRVGLAQARRRAIRGYSRGMRQRLGLGVAILSRPDLLILDEPTAGLDQEGLALLWSVIDEWRENGRIVLASTHELALMERRMDDICVLQEGRKLAQGTSDDLRKATALPHRIWFETGSAPAAKVALLRDALRRWGGGPVEVRGDRILVEVDAADILELMKVQSGFPGVVVGVRVEEPTLDLVYDKLLGVA